MNSIYVSLATVISQEPSLSLLGLGKPLFLKYTTDPVDVKLELIMASFPLGPVRPEIKSLLMLMFVRCDQLMRMRNLTL